MQSNGVDKAYSIEAEGEISTILSNFSTEYIYDTIDKIMEERYETFSTLPKQNFVDALEMSFKQLLDGYTADKENIEYVRSETYNEIIHRISLHSGVSFNYEEDNVDIYYLASIIYDLFIANYDTYVFKFLYNYIISQKNFLYQSLNLEHNKHDKDTSTIYNTENYTDQQMAIINANLDTCIGYISSMDFDAKTVLSYIYNTPSEIVRMNYLLNRMDSSVNLFQVLILPLLQNPIVYPSLSTSLKLEIQRNNIIGNNVYTGE